MGLLGNGAEVRLLFDENRLLETMPRKKVNYTQHYRVFFYWAALMHWEPALLHFCNPSSIVTFSEQLDCCLFEFMVYNLFQQVKD
jgi:hypothetical protein